MGESRIAQQMGVQKEAGKVEMVMVAAGTFPWLNVAVEAPISRIQFEGRIINLVDLSMVGPMRDFSKRLNGGIPRTDALIRNGIGEGLINHGRIRGTQVFRPLRPDFRGPIFGLQSRDPNESTRVNAFITQPTESSSESYIVGRTTYGDSRRAAKSLGAWYRS